jgi:ABC-type microcin C transport system permease subunit YejE
VKDGEKNAFDEVKADEAEGKFSISQFIGHLFPTCKYKVQTALSFLVSRTVSSLISMFLALRMIEY